MRRPAQVQGGIQRDGAGAGRLRCAIYTRKSSEEGLDQDFNSLHAQRDACAAYVVSQRHEGWQQVPDPYDDGGYSGGSMERPGLERLLDDIGHGRIDIVVVYKVDRLTRSLADFARIVDLFDRKGVSFVSVTQSFNTTTSMGRLTLNVLLSFAQFEREVTAERIRDKIAASKKKGIWMGGNVPFGYRVLNRKLVIDEQEAVIVQLIFDLYRSTLSTIATALQLKRRGIVTRCRMRAGKVSGGIPFGRGGVAQMLKNRIYAGDIQHKGVWHRGEHPAIVDQALFEDVQTLLSQQRSGKGDRTTSSGPSLLLTGRIVDSNGNRMSPSHTSKKGIRYPYYVSRALLDGESEKAGKPSRVSAPRIEVIVIGALQKAGGHDDSNTKDQRPHPRIANTSGGTGPRPSATTDDATLISPLDHVQVFSDRIVLHVRTEAGAVGASDDNENPSTDGADHALEDNRCQLSFLRTITVPCKLSAYRPERDLFPARANGSSSGTLTGPQSGNHRRLLKAIHRARQWHQQLLSGTVASIRDIAASEGRSERNVRTFINLAFLSPTIVQAVVDGRIDPSLGATAIANDLPLEWHEQEQRILGKTAGDRFRTRADPASDR